MTDFLLYQNNPHDFDLYSSTQDHALDFNTNPFALPATTYSVEQQFTTSYDSMLPLADPRPQDVQFQYDALAQGGVNKPFPYQPPAASPHSPAHSIHDQPPVLSASSESGASVSSSAMHSPQYEQWNPIGLGLTSYFEYPGIIPSEKTFVDPNLIHPNFAFAPHTLFPDITATPSPFYPVVEQPSSPALSHISSQSHRPGSVRPRQGSASPFLRTQQYPYPHFVPRRGSVNSLHSHHSSTSRKSGGSSCELDDESREKGLCPLPECGRVFKDLKAHMLTHQNERPEKCPIATCEYSIKGFARRYDKNRHTLTHYKGTMVCGFCPHSGSAAERSFNRADVFKRHLISVHHVEQNPPNSRKKSPAGRKAATGQQHVAGTCSTCSVTFANAQEFYEHLDECVLRVVQQADPSEAINQRLLTSVAEDKDVTETLDRNGLSKSIEYTVPSYDEEEEDEEEDLEVDDHNDDNYGARRSRSRKGGIKSVKGH